MKYLLPCSCGKSVAIEVSQAGQSVACACGNMLDVPAMRLIRQLPPAETPPSKTRVRDRPWSLRQRLFFSGGLAILVGGLISAGISQAVRYGLETEENPADSLRRTRQLERAHEDIDSMNIVQTWEFWTMVRTDAIGPYNPPPFIWYRLWSAAWLRYVVISSIVAAVGLVLMLSAFVAGPKRKPRGRGTTKSEPAHRK